MLASVMAVVCNTRLASVYTRREEPSSFTGTVADTVDAHSATAETTSATIAIAWPNVARLEYKHDTVPLARSRLRLV